MYIKREDAIKAISEYFSDDDDSHWNAIATYIIKDIPSAEKQGEWKPFDLSWGRSIYACTSCGESTEVPTMMGKPLYDFCPNCGCRMKGADDE